MTYMRHFDTDGKTKSKQISEIYGVKMWTGLDSAELGWVGMTQARVHRWDFGMTLCTFDNQNYWVSKLCP
jgi:hypothetical protein